MVCKKCIRPNFGKGFSLLELVIAVAAAMVLILGIGGMMAQSQQGYTRMYKRAHSNVVRDAYWARRVFDRVVRKSTIRRCDLISDSEIYVYYYSDTPQSPNLNLTDPDSFARFYLRDGNLWLDYAEEVISPAGEFETLDPASLVAHTSLQLTGRERKRDKTSVDSLIFSNSGRAIEMAMLLVNDKDESMFVTSSAVRHNK